MSKTTSRQPLKVTTVLPKDNQLIRKLTPTASYTINQNLDPSLYKLLKAGFFTVKPLKRPTMGERDGDLKTL